MSAQSRARPLATASDIPDDVLLHILSLLPLRDRLAASSCCRAWVAASAAPDPGVWGDVVRARRVMALQLNFVTVVAPRPPPGAGAGGDAEPQARDAAAEGQHRLFPAMDARVALDIALADATADREGAFAAIAAASAAGAAAVATRGEEVADSQLLEADVPARGPTLASLASFLSRGRRGAGVRSLGLKLASTSRDLEGGGSGEAAHILAAVRPGLTGLTLLAVQATPAGLGTLVAALCPSPALRSLELAFNYSYASFPAAVAGGVANPGRAWPQNIQRAPLLDDAFPAALLRLARAAPGLTSLTLEAPRVGWAAGAVAAQLENLATLTIRDAVAVPLLFLGGGGPQGNRYLTALTSLDLVGCGSVVVTACPGIPLARLRVWDCIAAPTRSVVRAALAAEAALDGARKVPAGGEEGAGAGAAAVDGARVAMRAWAYDDDQAAEAAGRPGGAGGDEAQGMQGVVELDPRISDLPWLTRRAVASLAPTLRHLEIVRTMPPTGLMTQLAPALTRLTCFRVDQGIDRAGDLVVTAQDQLSDMLALIACFAPVRPSADPSSLFAAAPGLRECRILGTGGSYRFATPGVVAAALRTLDLRGVHLSAGGSATWPAGVTAATTPCLAELLLGCTRFCLGEHPDPEHAVFDLSAPPDLPRTLTRLAFCLVGRLSLDEQAHPAAWAASLARLPALADLIFDMVEGADAGVFRGLGFVQAAARARRADGLGVIVAHPSLASLVPEDIDATRPAVWVGFATDDEDWEALGLEPEPTATRRLPARARRAARLGGIRRPLDGIGGAAAGFHARGEACAATGLHSCTVKYCAAVAMRGSRLRWLGRAAGAAGAGEEE